MASAKDIYEADMYAAGMYAAGIWRGVGVTVVIQTGPFIWEALDAFVPGFSDAAGFVPGFEIADSGHPGE